MSNLDPEWLLREDIALKAALQGVVVKDGNSNNRRLGVWFGQPDPEVREQAYPYATIDLIDVTENTPQVHSQWGSVDNYPYLGAKAGNVYDPALQGYGDFTSSENLLPMLLVYQVQTFARHPRHDRAILVQLNAGALHPRFAQVTCDDNTVRRVVVRNFAKRDTTTDNKRLFRSVWTLAMTSELFAGSVALTQRVQQVIINSGSAPRTPPDTILTPILYP